MSYTTLPHIGCGGSLTYEKDVIENRTVNSLAVKRFGAKAIIKQLTKRLYRCDKCNDLVNVISCPSWESYVLSGKIRLPKAEWERFKNDRRRGVVEK